MHKALPFLLLTLFAGPALLSLTAHASMGPLDPIIRSGDDGRWEVSRPNQDVVLRNSNAAGDLTYYYINSAPQSHGQRTISVTLQVPYATGGSQAGLLYAFEDNPRSYYLFTIAGDSTAKLTYRGQNGFENQLSTSIEIGPDSTTELTLVETGQTITLYVNGNQLGQMGNSRMGRGAVGIVAADVGNYRFSDFSVRTGAQQRTGSRPPPDVSKPVTRRINNTRLQDYLDPKLGMVQRRVPLPADWQLDGNPNDKVLLRGPNNIVAYYTESGRLVDSPNPGMLEAARVGGAQTVPLMPVREYLQRYYAPGMAQTGFELTNSFPMPSVQEFWELFGARMPQGLSRKRYEAIGAEWAHANGNRAFTILVQNVLTRPDSTLWTVGAHEIYAESSSYQRAKQVFINAHINTEVNPAWQIQMNKNLLANLQRLARESGRRMQRSQAAHLNRMNAILERGKTSRAIAKINSDIIDTRHSSYLKTSSMVSRSNEKFNDMIAERSVIGNPETGELYKVDAGANNHWVSTDGLHLPTDNALYDPRTDPLLNNKEWMPFELVR
ncbi:MAG: hypothetical protein AB8C02_03490 [Halioglobus sp.]